MGALSESVMLNDGRRAAFEVIGDGPPLLYFQGGPGFSAALLRQDAELLADRYAVYLIDPAGSGGSTMLDLKAGPMRDHDFSTLFKLDHMLKDVALCLDEGQTIGAPFPFAALVREILTSASGMGHGDDDFAALISALEGLAGTRL